MRAESRRAELAGQRRGQRAQPTHTGRLRHSRGRLRRTVDGVDAQARFGRNVLVGT